MSYVPPPCCPNCSGIEQIFCLPSCCSTNSCSNPNAMPSEGGCNTGPPASTFPINLGAKPADVSSPTPSLAGFHISLPRDIQSSIIGSVLEEVYVFVIENGKADDLKTFLEDNRFKNIVSKKENDLTTITAQKEQLFTTSPIPTQSASASAVASSQLILGSPVISGGDCTPEEVPGLGTVYAC